MFSDIPPVNEEAVLGYSVQEKENRVKKLIGAINEAIEVFKQGYQLTEDQVAPTIKTFKFLNKQGKDPWLPIPKIVETGVEVPSKIGNPNLDRDAFSLTLDRFQGAGRHRTFSLKYRFTYDEDNFQGETQYVSIYQ